MERTTEPLSSRLVFALITTCINSAFTRGYNIISINNIVGHIEAWAEKKTLQEVIDNNTSKDYDETVLPGTGLRRIEGGFAVGAIMGSLLIPSISTKFGRKGGLLMTNFITIFGVLFTGYCKLFDLPNFLMVGRYLFGLACGLNMALGPMYLMESATRNQSGRIGSIFSMFTSIGEFFGCMISIFLASEDLWPLVFSLNIVPTILQLSILPLFPESPKFSFVIQKKDLESRKAVLWFRGEKMKEEEYQQLVYELAQKQQLGNFRIHYFPTNDILLRALVITTVVTCSPPLCGMKIIAQYVTGGLLYIMHTDQEAIGKQVLLYLLILLASSINIILINRVSRRILLFACFLTMSISCTLSYIVFCIFQHKDSIVFLTVFFLFSFKLGNGCLANFIVCEYFNTLTAPFAFSVGIFCSWVLRGLELLYSSKMLSYLGGYLFLNYAILNALLASFTYIYIIDTRYIPLQQVYLQIKRTYEE